MRRSVLSSIVLAAGALLFAAWGAVAAEAPGELSARLKSTGRAIVSFQRNAEDPFEGRSVTEPGMLVLEPGLADVRFERTGERLTVRHDGGEWLQPQLKQMIVMGPREVAAAKHWWEVLGAGRAPGARVVREAPNRYLVVGPRGEGEPDSARVELDRAGLPVRLEVMDGTGHSEYRFGRWRFEKARGRKAFAQRAPSGVEVVRLR